MKLLKSLAWVIGINHYDNYPELHAAVNDAREFAEKLKMLQYDVIESIDEGNGKVVTYDSILDKKQIFLNKIEDNVDVALIYFAGHGCMVNKEDCLILSDTDSYQNGRSVKARGKSLVLNEICQEMNALGNQKNILIVDACRVDATGYRGVKKENFGQNTSLPFQSFFAFSTSPETTAADGMVHSLYTQLLLNKMMEENIPIEQLFKSVRREMRFNKPFQIGQEVTSLVDDYSFNYGQMKDGVALEYSESALEDSNFKSSNEICAECLEQFKSYNYYKQEDALTLFHKNYKNFSEEEKFVIGRNILQAASGGCWECEAEFTYSRLKLYLKDCRNAVLDGILYEIYFDSENRFRDTLKGKDLLSKIDKLSVFDEFKSSFSGIRTVLNKYRDKLNYIPGDKTIFSVKLDFESLGKNNMGTSTWKLLRAEFKGTDIKGKIFSSYTFDIKELRQKISCCLAIPTNLLKLNFSKEVGEDDLLILDTDVDNFFNEY